MDLFSLYAVDEDKENNGTWFPVGGNVEFLIARAGNKAYGKELQAQLVRHATVLDAGDEAAEAKSEEIMLDVACRTLLKGWRTVVKGEPDTYLETLLFQGKHLTYSVENAKLVLGTKGMRHLRATVRRLSDDADAYKLKEEREQGEV